MEQNLNWHLFCLVCRRALFSVHYCFSLYINDFMAGIKSEIRLFADDCVCYRQTDSSEDTSKPQKDIGQLGKWARKWGMRFQPVKCNIMQLTRKRIIKINAVYSFEGTVLENVGNIKYLGVTISKDLKWNTHVSNVCTKANRTLGFLRRNLSSCPQRERHTRDWCDQSWSMLALFGTYME